MKTLQTSSDQINTDVFSYHNTTFNSDNRKIFQKLPDNSIDLILTDPPYKDYQSNRPVAHAKVKKIHQSDFDLPFFIEQSARVLKPGCHLYCWCDHYTFPFVYQEIINLRARIKQKRSQHFLKYKNCLIWVKNNHGSGDLKGNFAPQHEFILFACKGNKGRQIIGRRQSNVFYKKIDSRIEFYKKVSNYKYKHGTSKPVEILMKLIEVSSQPGELIFDPYAGSMSTGEACLQTGRNYILIEIDEEFYRQGLERLKECSIFK